MGLGEAVRDARKNLGMNATELASIVGRTPQYISQLENGARGVEQSPHLVRQLEIALRLQPGELARYLPEDHPARFIAQELAVEIEVLGEVGAGPGHLEGSSIHEKLAVGHMFYDCVAYKVRGDSMVDEHILNGDYILTKRNSVPEQGDICVAWINEEGCVCKRLDRGRLKSPDGWEHTISPGDYLFGVVVGIIRRTNRHA
ncbi:lexa repressor : LexA repressor OS=Desulforudis audaxviator (strain MP104C) GN=Daud_1912 PE=3 SV=1: HTH_31: Peptidase_S24 [Tuwongella immobilis]|uniref:HTH cro/C1-type domain-containing protein n=2 Tax=Tuwongella immobilis TaxID=692036 RepID=A0A6C2YKN7_9BACT|nr:lexa repressor : LexA repressor OS=Desulforudis audaxviator (strain MP104C) GN=Daud_1912 PE=3 SV=1: HTH_31: Peptidase_S24 [Tuwongella immobilis]VTS00501.1 lexa repressor : LexA repressor OS=Desulforudis audaxviator (strain MP104C) GN=Daud_1912 PE=3 SV=1: HTH_31: Peptidase_S24 [Tuwongella immobilis]